MAKRKAKAAERGFTIYDTETTGLTLHPDAPLDKQPRIIEFGALMLSMTSGEVIDSISLLINPGCKLPPEIPGITGIKDEDLIGQPSFEKAWPKIRAFLDRSDIMLAHNEPFDHQLVEMELKRAAIKGFKWPPTFCSVGLYRDQWGFDPKLTQLYERVMGKSLDQKHRALSDVQALAEVVQKDGLIDVLRGMI